MAEKSIFELFREYDINVVKVNSQKTNKFLIFQMDKIRRYKNLIITKKFDAVDEIISILNKKYPNWYFDIVYDSKNPTLSKGKKIITEYLSYDCPRVNDIINDPDKDLFFTEDNISYFNLFQNSYYLDSEVKENLIGKDWSVIQKIIWNLSGENPDNYSWIINWLSVLYQYPTYRFTTSLIFIGQKGSGKGMFASVMRFLFGNCSYTANSTDLTSKFNAQLFEGKMLLLANEILDQHNKFQFSNNLKEFITENVISVEKKFLDRYQAKNYIKLILFSNSSQPITIEEDDRRYAVFYTAKKIKEVLDYSTRNSFFEDKEFFKNQCEGFAYFLQNNLIDISKVTDEPIMTEAKENIIRINQSDFRSIIDEIIEDEITNWKEDLYGLFYLKYNVIYADYSIKAQDRTTIKKVYPRNKFGSKLRLEQYEVENLKSIDNEKGTWVLVPFRIVEKIYAETKPEIVERIKNKMQKRMYKDE